MTLTISRTLGLTTQPTALADVIGSTTALIKAAKNLPARKFIVATDNGIFYKCAWPRRENFHGSAYRWHWRHV